MPIGTSWISNRTTQRPIPISVPHCRTGVDLEGADQAAYEHALAAAGRSFPMRPETLARPSTKREESMNPSANSNRLLRLRPRFRLEAYHGLQARSTIWVDNEEAAAGISKGPWRFGPGDPNCALLPWEALFDWFREGSRTDLRYTNHDFGSPGPRRRLRAIFPSRDGMERNCTADESCCTASRDWGTQSNSFATHHWFTNAAGT